MPEERRSANLIVEFEGQGGRGERLILLGPSRPGHETSIKPGMRFSKGDAKGKHEESLIPRPMISPWANLVFVHRLQQASPEDVPKIRRQMRGIKAFISAETSGTVGTDWSLFKEVDFLGTNEKELVSLARGLGIEPKKGFNHKNPGDLVALVRGILYAAPRIKMVNVHFSNGMISVAKPFGDSADHAKVLSETGKLVSVGLGMYHAYPSFEDAKPRFAVLPEDVAYHLEFGEQMKRLSAKEGGTALDPFGTVWRLQGPHQVLASFTPKCVFVDEKGRPKYDGTTVGAGDLSNALRAVPSSTYLRRIAHLVSAGNRRRPA